jgi:hypothetical protein
MPKSNKRTNIEPRRPEPSSRIPYYSETVENPEKPRGDARMSPMNMENNEDWTEYRTRKLKMRHGSVGRNLGVAEKQAGE